MLDNNTISWKKIRVYPNGNIDFIYNDKIITEPKNGKPIIRFNRRLHGIFDAPIGVLRDIGKSRSDELRDDIPSRN